ncbi:hypothetical protein D9758_017192 [Tetrapyrgos nigripes]|uniref:Uncharacterized protein n=1 Tax=Tetrapyrgos nigripes TaxID=182062 RepID=A0A8H5FCT7_9AGAR|nr:hypothetical protein D9758_017192 [Tetrapyrgos nigripes]
MNRQAFTGARSLASVLRSMVQPCPMEVRRFSLKTMEDMLLQSVQLGLQCCTCTQTHQNQNQTPEQGQCFMPVPLLKQNVEHSGTTSEHDWRVKGEVRGDEKVAWAVGLII